MFSKQRMNSFTADSSARLLDRLHTTLEQADAVLIGAGAGLSTSAGFTYSGERFKRYFSDHVAIPTGLLLFRARDKIKTGNGCWAELGHPFPETDVAC